MWIALFLSCTTPPSSQLPIDPICDPRMLEVNEVRIRPLLCGDENIPNGDIRRGDFVLENQHLRFGFRNVGASLYFLEGQGGSLIDATLRDEEDALIEILPWDQGILNIQNIETVNDTALSQLIWDIDGEKHTWSLYPNQYSLFIEPALDVILRPKESSKVIGQQIQPPQSNICYTIEGSILDTPDGIIVENFSAISIAQCEESWMMHQSTPESTPQIQEITINTPSSTQPAQFYLWKEEDLLGALPINDTIAIPQQATDLQYIQEGCTPNLKQEITSEMTFEHPSQCGSISIRILDRNREIAGQLISEQGIWFIPKEGLKLHQVEVLENALIGSGFAYTQVAIGTIDPLQHPHLDIELQQIHQHLSLYIPQVSTNTRWVAEDLWQYLSYQNSMLLYAQSDHVLEIPTLSHSSIIENALLSHSNHGSLLSWPWLPNLQPGFGAIPTQQLNTLQILDQAGHQQRLVFVDWELLEYIESSTQSPSQSYPLMDGVLINDQVFLEEIKDEWPVMPHRMLGEVTWFHESILQSAVELEGSLLEGQYSTGNGPFIEIQTSVVTTRNILLHIASKHPSWMNVTQMALWNDQGLIQRWTIDSDAVERTITVPSNTSYYVAVWSEEERYDGQFSWAIQHLSP